MTKVDHINRSDKAEGQLEVSRVGERGEGGPEECSTGEASDDKM